MKDRLLLLLTLMLSCLLILNIANALEHNGKPVEVLHVADTSKVL